jgi:hypothetical protein
MKSFACRAADGRQFRLLNVLDRCRQAFAKQTLRGTSTVRGWASRSTFRYPPNVSSAAIPRSSNGAASRVPFDDRGMARNTSAASCWNGLRRGGFRSGISSRESPSRTPISSVTIAPSGTNGLISTSSRPSRRPKTTPRSGYGLTTMTARTSLSWFEGKPLPGNGASAG